MHGCVPDFTSPLATAPAPPPPPPVPLETLSKLGVLLGKNWQKALQVVDQNEVQCYQAEPSGRRIFEVRALCCAVQLHHAAPLHGNASQPTPILCCVVLRCMARVGST